VCVSACGNFGLAASSTGVIGLWNMQSGIHRRSFDIGPAPREVLGRSIHLRQSAAAAGGSKKRSSENRAISGLATDALNRVVIASTLDGTLNVSFSLKI
jgi:U3 small nucleolar RNA-associated protein 21